MEEDTLAVTQVIIHRSLDLIHQRCTNSALHPLLYTMKESVQLILTNGIPMPDFAMQYHAQYGGEKLDQYSAARVN